MGTPHLQASHQLIHGIGIDLRKPPFVTMKNGRVLHKDVVSYITQGHGWFEDARTPRQKVVAGSVIYQRAGVWHNFDPSPGTVWTEYWFLFDGRIAGQLFGAILPERQGVIEIEMIASLVEAWKELYDVWFFRQPGYQEYALLLSHQILTEIHLRRRGLMFQRRDDSIAYACHRMRLRLAKAEMDIPDLVKGLGMGYELFRKRFKSQIGCSPKQYFLMLKMNHASERLLKPLSSIKEIAAELGFDDPYYFSRIFRKKTGLSPRQYRHSLIRQENGLLQSKSNGPVELRISARSGRRRPAGTSHAARQSPGQWNTGRALGISGR